MRRPRIIDHRCDPFFSRDKTTLLDPSIREDTLSGKLINHILKQMTGFRLLLFVPYSVLEVPPLECSYSECVFVPDLVELSQM